MVAVVVAMMIINRVRTGPGKPGKSWNFLGVFLFVFVFVSFVLELWNGMANIITIKKIDLYCVS